MVTVHLTRHLFQFFPDLEDQALVVGGATAREVLDALDARAPGILFYLCDERGRLRPHVNVFIDTQTIRDRAALSDPVRQGGEVHILQALSGG